MVVSVSGDMTMTPVSASLVLSMISDTKKRASQTNVFRKLINSNLSGAI